MTVVVSDGVAVLLDMGAEADRLEAAVEKVLADGVRTGDLLNEEGKTPVSTSEMGDAVIALGANVALKRAAKGESGYMEYKEDWFKIDSDETPDGSDIKQEMEYMKKPVA